MCADLLSVGVANRVTLEVTGRRAGATAVVHERVACGAARLRAFTGRCACRPRSSTRSRRSRAGTRSLGSGGGAGRPARGARLAADNGRCQPRAVRVDPNLAAIDVYEALARRGQLAEIGLRTMRLRTEGSEFERVREAFPDDPLRSINWRATARTGRLMATELIPERAQPLVICLDHGRLMGVGAGELTKLDHAINAALLLVHVALRSGDRAGMLAFADTVTSTLPPRARERRNCAAFSTPPARSGRARPRPTTTTRSTYLQPVADAPFAGGHLHRRPRSRPGTRRSSGSARVCAAATCPLVVTVRDPALDDAANAVPRSRRRDLRPRGRGRAHRRSRGHAARARRSGVETIDADARTLSPRLVNRYLDLKRRARL